MIEAAKHYLELRPVGVRSRFQVYKAYLQTLVARFLRKREFVTVGQFLSKDSLVRYRGLVLYARSQSEDIGYYARRTKPWTSEWFKPQRGDVVVDCGSSVGIFTLVALQVGAVVYAFEANPATFQILRRNIELNGLGDVAHTYNTALSDKVGSATLYAADHFTGTSSLSRDWAKEYLRVDDKITALQTPVTTLDDALDELKRVDWLLIDVEGHEDALLRGASSLLERTERIIIEVSHKNSKEVREQLLRHGFSESARGTPESTLRYYLFSREPSGPDRAAAGPVLSVRPSRSEVGDL